MNMLNNLNREFETNILTKSNLYRKLFLFKYFYRKIINIILKTNAFLNVQLQNKSHLFFTSHLRLSVRYVYFYEII